MKFVFFSISFSIFLNIAFASESISNNLQPVLAETSKTIERPSRRTIDKTIEKLFQSGADGVPQFLKKWRNKQVWFNSKDNQFFFGPDKRGVISLVDIDTGVVIGPIPSRSFKQIKPNSGVRSIIDAALVKFQLSDPNPKTRALALETLERNANKGQLKSLRESIESETNVKLKVRKERLERLLTITYGDSASERISAIESFNGDVGIDVRARLNPLISTTRSVVTLLPKDKNVARTLRVGIDISYKEAHSELAGAGLAPKPIKKDARDAAIIANSIGGKVGTIKLANLDTEATRNEAYRSLAEEGKVPPYLTQAELNTLVRSHIFLEIYAEPDARVTTAALSTLSRTKRAIGINQLIDLLLDALSLTSIYFLAAVGLAITFGVMRVINMAHGEFIMIGAYTGYVVQQFITNHTLSIVVALPMAFLITFIAGVIMERLVIRHLMHRPLETLLATFGISIALQQLAKNIFGTQAVPLTAPSWLDGSLVFNDIVSISYIRIAIIILAIIFCILLLYILRKTRLGLEVRAVTQNQSMASVMGVNPDRINLLTFGLGSGIAGIAGVAIGLFAQVTSELGANYIVQSFMTVVVGGVGSIVGTLAGAGMIGSLQKVIEWFNPSNTLAAQTYMIIFVIVFIQFRPRGIIALRGRAAED